MFKQIALGQIRHLVTFLAGMLVAKGFFEASLSEAFVAISMALIANGWSAIEKLTRR